MRLRTSPISGGGGREKSGRGPAIALAGPLMLKVRRSRRVMQVPRLVEEIKEALITAMYLAA